MRPSPGEYTYNTFLLQGKKNFAADGYRKMERARESEGVFELCLLESSEAMSIKSHQHELLNVR